MKKISSATIAILILLLSGNTLLVTSCLKKGEKDPFISFKSRKARLEGTWTMQSGKEEVSTSPSGSTTVNTIVTDISNGSATITNGGVANTWEGYTNQYEFAKDGSYTITAAYTYGAGSVSVSYTESGYWKFLHKTADYKEKEAVQMNISETTMKTTVTGASPVTQSFTYPAGGKYSRTMKLVQLADKAMEMTVSKTTTDSTGTSVFTGSYVFKQ